MKRMMVALGAALLVVLGLTPAHADGDRRVRAVVAWDGGVSGGLERKELTSDIFYERQADGTGVILEFWDARTTDGAAFLQDYRNVTLVFQTPSGQGYGPGTGSTPGLWDFGTEPDNFDKDFNSIRGQDVGAMRVKVNMCAKDENGTTDRIWIDYRLRGDGTSEVVDQGHHDIASCASVGRPIL
jgi:hypothetical protein